MPSRHSTATPPVVLGHKVKTCHRGISAMLGKFLEKTVLLSTGRTVLGVAVSLIVFLAIPTTANASVTHVASASSTATSMTLPTHSAGDIIIMTATAGSGGMPTMPAGWTLISSNSVSGGNANSLISAYKIASSSSETSGTWSKANSLISSVFRDSTATFSIGAKAIAGNQSSSAIGYPAITLQETNGSSVVYRASRTRGGSGGTVDPQIPTGYTQASLVYAMSKSFYQLGATSVSSFTSGGVQAWNAITFEILATPLVPPDPSIVFESPTGSELLTFDFRTGDTYGLYTSLYRIPNDISFDTIQIKLPDSHSSSTNWYVSGYYQATSTLPVEVCAGTTGNNECNGILAGGGVSFTTSATCTIVSTGVCEMSFGSEYDMAGVLTYLVLAADPNIPYQYFSTHAVYGDVGYSCDGGNGNCLNIAPVIKLCKNGCSDDVFNSSQFNSSYVPYTRVVSVTPSATTTATSTSFVFGGTVNIMPEDFVASSTFRLSVIHQSSVQQVSALQAWESFTEGTYISSFYIDFPITAQGTTDYSTTTNTSAFPEGKYTISGELLIPDRDQSLWQSFLDILVTASGNSPAETEFRIKSWFIIGQPTFYDDLVTDVVSQTNLALIDLNVCSPFSSDFSISDCLLLLIIPPTATFQTMGDSLVNNALRIFPLGYITRMLEIVTLSTPLTPPALTYTYGTSAPVDIQGMTVSFQIFDGFTLIPTILADDGSGKDVWGIVMPYFNTIIALGVLGVILMDILKLGLPNFGGDTYATSGDVPVTQLSDQPDRNKVTYNQAMNIKIKNRTRRNL